MSSDIKQIKVGEHRVGIIGLGETLEDVAAVSDGMDDSEIRKMLLERLGKRNYIASPARERYEDAFFKEFCKYTGRLLDLPEIPGVLEIKVLGQGCSRCDQLERDVIQVVAELNIKADIEHVKNLKEIGAYGVMGTPALVINGQVMAVGKVPPRQKLTTWLTEAGEQIKKLS
jgi:small redox-active disulfide protein 2